MTISSRTRAIIQFLRRNDRHVSVKDIAEKLDLTERTIYRELPEVNQALSSFGLQLDSAMGKGMKLSGSQSEIAKLDDLVSGSSEDAYSAADRIAIIQFLLLKSKDYLKTQALAIDAKTSMQTVRNDLKSVEQSFEREHLSLVVKKSEGVIVEGSSLDKSHCLAKVLAQSIDIDVFFNWVIDGKDKGNPLLQLLYETGYHAIAGKVVNVVLRLSKKHEVKVSDGCLRDLILLITIFIDNVKQGVRFTGFHYSLDQFDAASSFTDDLIATCKSALGLQISNEEAGYLNWLVGVLIGDPNDKILDLDKLRISKQVVQLVTQVEERLGLQLRNDQSLVNGLSAHLTRTLSRIRSGMIISNPINKGIEQAYNELFKIVKESASQVFTEVDFPDEEIGYLVLYVAMALDQIADKSFRVLVVCSSGMGSSKLLASRLEREISEIRIQKSIALIDLYSESLDDYDLVISTVPLFVEHENCITVSPLLTEKEADEVKQRVRRHRTKKLSKFSADRTRNAVRTRTDSLAYLKEIQAIATWGIKIIENLQVFSSLGLQTDLMKGLGALIYRFGMVNDPELLIRYSQNNNGCFVVPGSKLAYSEFCVKELEVPTLLALKLDPNKIYTFGANHLTDLTSMVVLFYPHWNESLYIDFLHNIALMIIESSQCVSAFERGDRDAIVTILGERVAEYVSGMNF